MNDDDILIIIEFGNEVSETNFRRYYPCTLLKNIRECEKHVLAFKVERSGTATSGTLIRGLVSCISEE